MPARARPLRYHFSGIAGAGMNPLAQLMRARGHAVQGSDRALDQGKSREIAARLRELGVELAPQDGRAVTSAVDRFVYSSAVEADTPEMRAARTLGVETVPRPALLAEVVNAGRPGVAVAGTSGKSTIVGMVAWLLRESGVAATVIGGAPLADGGTGGCFLAGPVDGPVVVEACESDGTLVGYRPTIGVVHNISRDHAELTSLRLQFARFAANCRRLLANARCPEAAALARQFKAFTYGVAADADAPLQVLSVGPARACGILTHGETALTLDVPQPGLHNLENAAAAAVIAIELGLEPRAVAARLGRFPGVARRFEVVGTTAAGIRVVDDYAHNAEKLRAAVTTAQAGAPRVVAIFQPHGFGPARFLRPELRELLPRLLRPADRFCYAEIFYAGGTVARDITSRALAADLPAALECAYAADHWAARRWAVAQARPGDTVLVMGARDPDLPRLARSIFDSLAGLVAPAPLA
ncbi:MAG: UDP-N-acetylmuramate--alanine ligase [Candidatus Rokuibacteriota bacterium]|nr:MAG: UDP-N-acetylmuramate--alanine ligase [Candidatus Rokubacteria bacterium]